MGLDASNYSLRNPVGVDSSGYKSNTVFNKGSVPMDPMTLITLLGPSALQFIGGLFDDSKDKQLGESKRQFDISSKLQERGLGLEENSFLSRLLDQRGKAQGQQSKAQGFAAGTGMKY